MDALKVVPLTLCANKAGLVAGTTTTYSITANPLQYAIRGKFYSKATVTNGATPTTDAITGAAFVGIPVNAGSIFVFGYDASGNLKVTQGQVAALDVAGNFLYSPQIPMVQDTVCPFGYLVVKVGSTGALWTFGTSNLSGATGVTYAFQDLLTLPDRPQIS